MRKRFVSLCLIVILAACNYPGAAEAIPTATATEAATATFAPPPATDTPAPTPTLAFTDTPAIPTATAGPSATPLPTATATRPPATRVIIEPLAGALFSSEADGVTMTFRVHKNSKIVIPKTVTVRQAICREGHKISDHITFEPPPFFDVNDKFEFTMSQGDQVTISGRFISSTTATGTITLHLRDGGKNCTIVQPFEARAFAGG